MAVAKISALFILILYLKHSFGQQLNLCNKPGLTLSNMQIGSPQEALQRKASLVANSKTLNQASGNISPNIVQQQSNKLNSQLGVQPLNCQQPLNLQQPINVQQPQNFNLQPSLVNQNLQQQSLNLQPTNGLQQQILQLQNPSTPLNLQYGQNSPQMTPEISLASLPVVNGQLSGLPSQITQGVLLSNLGLTSSLPSLLPNICGPQPSVDQFSIIPQNNLASISNIPAPQNANFPASVSASVPTNNVPTSVVTIPITQYQNTPQTQPNLQVLDVSQNLLPMLQSQPNQLTLNSVQTQQGAPVQSQPVQVVASIQPQPVVSSVQNQAVIGAVQTQPVVMAENIQSVQNQPVVTSAQIQPIVAAVQPQPQSQPAIVSAQSTPSNIPSYVLSQNQAPNTVQQCSGIPGFSSDSFMNQLQNQGSKSSNIKALLPLLFNLLKEKNCCGCRNNQNCGCMGNSNNNNYPQDHQVFSGYSNQMNYGQVQEDAKMNDIDSEEFESAENVRRRNRKYRNKLNSVDLETDEDDVESGEYEDDD